IEIKLILSTAGFDKMNVTGSVVELFFDMNNENIFSSGYFEKVLGYINDNYKNTSRVKQGKQSLSVQFRIPQHHNSAEKLQEIRGFVANLANL
ncbi:MAG TPA: hypothetical protein DCX92_02015, partial [Bacteroidetes bacterium]|nr:hypothetical protein [Bacteroidota bacterium]